MTAITQKMKAEIMTVEPFKGHPSRELEHRIKQLEKIVLMLAEEIDNINMFGKFG